MIRILPLALLLVPLAGAAQDPPIRWGALSEAEKTLEAWPDDPDATAIVLGDVGFGKVRFTRGSGLTYQLRRHVRVKVLDEEGYRLGEFSRRYEDRRKVSIRRVRGQTFVPQPDGSYRRVALDGGDIFDERVDDDTREVRFSMPALAPGAIFEYEYTYETDGVTVLPTWRFQRDEPTLVSEVRLESPDFFEFVTLSQGTRIEGAPPRSVSTRLGYEASERRWEAHDVPALRDEPYTTTEADYVEKIDFQLSLIRWPDAPHDRILSSWPEVASDLWDHPRFGAHLGGSRRVRALAASVEGTPGEKARALYDLVRRDYVWTGEGGIFAARGLDDVLETKSGSEAELTLLLLALLDAADVPAVPVVLSGRSRGRAITTYPIVGQFDTILALAMVPDEDLQLLSPLSPHRPYGEVPVDALNGDGWMVDREAPQWISFSPPGTTATTAAVRATLAADGGLSGELQLQLTGYAAFDARGRLADAGAGGPATDAVASAADAGDALEIEVVEVTGVETPEEPLRITSTFTAPGAEVIGDEMYLTPSVAMRLEENPFERETRAFPVDFAYPFTRTFIADIALPEGWEAVDLPEPVRMTIPGQSVSYTRVMGPRPGGLQLRAVLTVAGAQVGPDEYSALRDLYDEIVAAETEAVVIARAADPAPATTGDDTP